ncbi:MAG: L,D-transpeptidase [Nostocales cyanobacterium 94392]|nr:L,D-transpeptidase [Nostocales cyanobacterium 94392]
MTSILYYYKTFKFSLVTIGLLLWLQLAANAQTTVKEGNNQTGQPEQLNSKPILDSPLLQPNFPSRAERVRRLLMMLKHPELIPPHTTEQNIHLLLSIKQRRLYVYQGDVLLDSYPVAIGKPKWETPIGKFKVINMVENPAWENPFVDNKQVIPPGLQNPLGERWIGFWTDGRDEIGFHGTYNRDSVGKAISHGCVRMYNEDVRKLYELVTIGTPVTVVP